MGKIYGSFWWDKKATTTLILLLTLHLFATALENQSSKFGHTNSLGDYFNIVKYVDIPGIGVISSAVVDPIYGFSYWSTQDTPAKIVSLQSVISTVDLIYARSFYNYDLFNLEDSLFIITPLYTINFYSMQIKLNTTCLCVENTLQLQEGEVNITSGVIDVYNQYAYFATGIYSSLVVTSIGC